MRAFLLALVATTALLVTAGSASAATPIPYIGSKAKEACVLTYAIWGAGSGEAARRVACRGAWRSFDRQLLDRQIRAWYRDVRAERDPVRYMDVWQRCLQQHRPGS